MPLQTPHAGGFQIPPSIADSVLDQCDALVFAMDLRGRYTVASRAFCTLVGVESAKLVGQTDESYGGTVPQEELAAAARGGLRS